MFHREPFPFLQPGLFTQGRPGDGTDSPLPEDTVSVDLGFWPPPRLLHPPAFRTAGVFCRPRESRFAAPRPGWRGGGSRAAKTGRKRLPAAVRARKRRRRTGRAAGRGVASWRRFDYART